MVEKYKALSTETLPLRLSSISEIVNKIGPNADKWRVKEVGDGNLNLVFAVKGPKDEIIIKQALPYVRVVGESWPLTLDRAYYEYNALIRQEKRDPGVAPAVFYFNREQGLIAMECLSDHLILRGKLIAGEKVLHLGEVIGKHCARLAFRGSDLSMQASEKKTDVSLFQGNIELMAITENLVFTDPYFDAEMNNHTPGLEPTIKILRDDVLMKTNAQHMLKKFTSHTETMCHGDLHSGSIMCTETKTRVIDPEFAFYGPMGFDLGMNIANLLMAYFSQPAHRKTRDDIIQYQDWICSVIEETSVHFCQEFSLLWETERNGVLYPQKLFEDQGQNTKLALATILSDIWRDAMSVCGIEMHRRCLSLAHNADFETIEDVSLRAKLEGRNLMMGRDLVLDANTIKGVKDLIKRVKVFNEKDLI